MKGPGPAGAGCSSAELQVWLREAEAPGVAVARFDRDGLVDAAGAGLADPATGAPAGPETTWLWYSVTKLLTVELLLRAEAEGRLELDLPVHVLLPEFRPRLGGARPDVPLRSLAAHTSGLPDPPPLFSLRAPGGPSTPGRSRLARYMRWWGRLHAAPGVRSRYSNLGFVALGEAIAAAAGGADFRELAEQQLEGCGRAGLGLGPELLATHARGQLRRGSPYQLLMELLGAGRIRGSVSGPFRAYGPLVMDAAAAGGLIADVRAVASWLGRHLRGLAAARRPTPLASGAASGFGLGWRLGAGGQVEHQGSGLGFMAHVRLDPRRGLGVCAVTNRSGDRGPEFAPLGELVHRLLPPA